MSHTCTVDIAELPNRILNKIHFSASTGHWLWTGALSQGYGVTTLNGGPNQPAHRVVYEMLIGPIQTGFEYRHAAGCPRNCVSPFCCRPPGSKSSNTFDQVVDGSHYNARKTHCPQGHEYSPQNTRYNPRGDRACRLCHNQRRRKVGSN